MGMETDDKIGNENTKKMGKQPAWEWEWAYSHMNKFPSVDAVLGLYSV